MKLAERKQVEKENKMKDMKILKELRQGPMKTMKDDEYAMIEEEVSQKGMSGIKGYAKYTVEKAMREMAYAMKKASGLAVGDMVSWQASGGTARGKIEHIMRDGVLGIPKSSFSIKAEKDDPAVLIRIYRDGEETETLVGHKASTLKKA